MKLKHLLEILKGLDIEENICVVPSAGPQRTEQIQDVGWVNELNSYVLWTDA